MHLPRSAVALCQKLIRLFFHSRITYRAKSWGRAKRAQISFSRLSRKIVKMKTIPYRGNERDTGEKEREREKHAFSFYPSINRRDISLTVSFHWPNSESEFCFESIPFRDQSSSKRLDHVSLFFLFFLERERKRNLRKCLLGKVQDNAKDSLRKEGRLVLRRVQRPFETLPQRVSARFKRNNFAPSFPSVFQIESSPSVVLARFFLETMLPRNLGPFFVHGVAPRKNEKKKEKERKREDFVVKDIRESAVFARRAY